MQRQVSYVWLLYLAYFRWLDHGSGPHARAANHNIYLAQGPAVVTKIFRVRKYFMNI